MLWRARKSLILTLDEVLADGSYHSRIYDSADRQRAHPLEVRVVEYELTDRALDGARYRLVTTLLDPELASADALAATSTERWQFARALDELKTHQRGPRPMLRSKTPEGVYQEVNGYLLTHYAIRTLMHEVAAQAGRDPDRLSFTRSLRDRQLSSEDRQHDPRLHLRQEHWRTPHPSPPSLRRRLCPHNQPAKKFDAGQDHPTRKPTARSGLATERQPAEARRRGPRLCRPRRSARNDGSGRRLGSVGRRFDDDRFRGSTTHEDDRGGSTARARVAGRGIGASRVARRWCALAGRELRLVTAQRRRSDDRDDAREGERQARRDPRWSAADSPRRLEWSTPELGSKRRDAGGLLDTCRGGRRELGNAGTRGGDRTPPEGRRE